MEGNTILAIIIVFLILLNVYMTLPVVSASSYVGEYNTFFFAEFIAVAFWSFVAYRLYISTPSKQ